MVGILPVADSEIVRRRSHHKIDALVRQTRHSCGAILFAKIKAGHKMKFRVDTRFVQAENKTRGLFPGSTGCQPVLSDSLPKSSSHIPNATYYSAFSVVDRLPRTAGWQPALPELNFADLVELRCRFALNLSDVAGV